MEDPEQRMLKKSPSERRRSVSIKFLNGSTHRLSNVAVPLSSSYLSGGRRSSQTPSMLSASLASLANEGFLGNDEDNGSGGSSGGGGGGANGENALNEEAQNAEDSGEDVESAKHHSLELQVEMLRGKLSRRNTIIEVIRRAYYHDVIIVKEELRHAIIKPPTSSSPTHANGKKSANNSNHALQSQSSQQQQQQQQSVEDRLAAVPSVDLRDALQLFAPAETVLQVHPCEACGGYLELVHGEVWRCSLLQSKELQAARQEMMRASKGEQQIRSVVHRMRTEAKEMEEVNDALQQRIKALVKENSYTLEQLQAARKAERDQKTSIANLRSKLQLAQGTQEEIDQLATEFKDIKQQLIRSNHDRDIFSASNNHLKEELAEVTKGLHQTKVEKAQIESDFGTTFYRLQEEIKKSRQLADDLAVHQQQLKEKTTLSGELQQSLVSLKEELVTALQRFEQTKRHLEDQLIDEERAHEEMQEQNLEFRKTNKKLAKELEAFQKDPTKALDGSRQKGESGGGSAHQQHPGGVTPAELKGIMRKRFDDLLCQLEWSQMRENDLTGVLQRQDAARAAAASKPMPVRRMLSRMPSTTVVTRFIPSADSEIAKAMMMAGTATGGAADGDGGQSTRNGSRQKNGSKAAGGGSGSRLYWNGEHGESDGADDDGFEDNAFMGGGTLEIDDKNFEAYHQEVHRMLTEIEEGRDKNQKQQKVIVDMERKHQVLIDRFEEAKLTIEALTGSVNALKMRLNQDSAGAAEELEDMLRQLEEGKRDQQYETEKCLVLREALRSISDKMFELSDNQSLKGEINVEFPTFDDDRQSAPGYGGANSNEDGGDSHLVPELYRKKQELRRKVMMEKEMTKFSQTCHLRSEIVNLEVRKLREVLESTHEELDEVENKIDSDQLQLRTLEADIAKLRLTVEMGKNNLQRTEKTLKSTAEDLQDSQRRCEGQKNELDNLRAAHDKLQEDHKRLTMMLFEKTKAWEKEINSNDRSNLKITTLEASLLAMTAARDSLHSRLQDIGELAEYRRRTNRSVEISAIAETTESDMQTDRWKPHGLILRQRNSPDSMPQRFLGKASVMIACPELSTLPSSKSSSSSSANQEFGGGSSIGTDTPSFLDADEHRRDFLELNMYPSAKAGGRQIKTSHGSLRPKAHSKLYLSSDGISQKYISPSPRQAFQDRTSSPSALFQDVQQRVRPYTSQS